MAASWLRRLEAGGWSGLVHRALHLNAIDKFAFDGKKFVFDETLPDIEQRVVPSSSDVQDSSLLVELDKVMNKRKFCGIEDNTTVQKKTRV